jgi:hypothetical protein
MVKKETIGKIQLVIGIILLLAGIIGGILTYNWYNQQIKDFSSELSDQLKNLMENENYTSFSEDSKIILRMELTATLINWNFFKTDIAMRLGLLCTLSIIISLLFITQGLVNMKQIIK